jgi:hypothetical protein
MSKLRLDPETLRVKSFETDVESHQIRGTVEGHSQTTATDYFTTICSPPNPGGGYPTLGGPLLPPEPVDPNEKYRLHQNDQ